MRRRQLSSQRQSTAAQGAGKRSGRALHGGREREIVAKYYPSAETVRLIQGARATGDILMVKSFGRLTEEMQRFFPSIPEFKGRKTMLRMGVNGKGTCFYHTIKAVIDPAVYIDRSGGEQMSLGRSFRLGLVKRVKDTWVPFWLSKQWPREKIPEISTIKKDLGNFAEWADIFTIIWTVQCILDLNIIVFDVKHSQIYCGTHRVGSKRPTIFMAWVKGRHFEPIVQWDSHRKTIRTLFNHNHPTLVGVLRMYESSQCPRVSLHHLLSRRRRAGGGAGDEEDESAWSFPFGM